MKSRDKSKTPEHKSEKGPRKKKSQKKPDLKKQKAQKKQHNKKETIITIVFLISISIFGIAIYALLRQLTRTETIDELELTPFSTEYIDDDSMELGSQTVEQAGKKGERKLYYKVTKTLIGDEQREKTYLDYEDTVRPVNEIIRRGTRKWQYMWCSDGGYRYFTDEQFSDPNTGFTHSSEDFCAKEGHGTMTQLADYPPALNNNAGASGYNIASNEDYARFKLMEAEWQTQQMDELTAAIKTSNNCSDLAMKDYEALLAETGAWWNTNDYYSLWRACMHDNGYYNFSDPVEFKEWYDKRWAELF